MHRRHAWVVGVGVVGLVIFGPGLIAYLHLSWQQHRLDRSLRRMEAAKQHLADERDRLTSDPVYVEGLIRSTFKVAKPGELVVPSDDSSRSRR